MVSAMMNSLLVVSQAQGTTNIHNDRCVSRYKNTLSENAGNKK